MSASRGKHSRPLPAEPSGKGRISQPLPDPMEAPAQPAARRTIEDIADPLKTNAMPSVGGADFTPSSAAPGAPQQMPPQASAAAYGVVNPQQQGAFRPTFDASNYTGSNKYSREGAQYYGKKKKMSTGKKVAVTICTILVLCLVGVGAAAALYYNSLNAELKNDNVEEAAAIEKVLAPTVSDEPFYMLLLGSDTRHDDEGQRSDTNIVARVDLSTNTVTMISIPRDTAINLEGYGTQKFNAAYNYEGVKGAINAANDLLGVKISHYAEVDFEGVVELIDAIGGVDVDVPMRIEDADAGGTVEQGMQHLDGEHALIFARSRSYTTGDFQRSTNQRILLEAVGNKIMAMSPTEIPGVIQKMCQCLSTDMSINDIVGYAQGFRNGDALTMYSAMVPSDVAMLDGVSYVVCDTAMLKQMMKAVDAGEDPSPYVTDYTVSSSEEAIEQGQEGTVVLPGQSEAETGVYYDPYGGYDPYIDGGGYTSNAGYSESSYSDETYSSGTYTESGESY